MSAFFLPFDSERFYGAKALVSLIEAENDFHETLSVSGKAKRTVHTRSREGNTHIGSLGEGTLHLVLKNYISANPDEQEVPFEKKFIDVRTEGTAYEVQTRNFASLKSKLAVFLPCMPVVIVYPVFSEKKIGWVDPETGERSVMRKSPKKESVYSIFSELIYLKDYLKNDRLSFCVFTLSGEELRLLCGKRSADRKKGSVRIDRIPTELHAVTCFSSARDFLRLLPSEDPFTVKSLCAHGKIDRPLAQKMVYCLTHAGLLRSEKGEKRVWDRDLGQFYMICAGSGGFPKRRWQRRCAAGGWISPIREYPNGRTD